MREIVTDYQAAPITNLANTPHFGYSISSGVSTIGTVPATVTTTFDNVDTPGGIPTIVFTATATGGQWSRKFLMPTTTQIHTGDVVRWRILFKSSGAYSFGTWWEGVKADGTTFTGANGTNGLTAVANQWTWLDTSYTTTVTQDGAFIRGAGLLMNGTPVLSGDVFKLAYAIVTINQPLPTIGERADGDVPGWTWSGTVGNSTSYGFVGQYRNKLHRHNSFGPDFVFGSTTSTGAATVSEVAVSIPGAPNIARAVDYQVTANAARTWSVLLIPHDVPIIQNEIWTYSGWLNEISTDTGAPFAISCRLSKSDGSNTPGSQSVTPSALGTWQYFSFSFTAAASAILAGPDNLTAANQMYFGVLVTAALQGAHHFQVAGLSLERGNTVNGPYSPPYFPDANGSAYNDTNVLQTFDGNSYNSTDYDTIIDGGGVIQYV